MTTQDLTQTTTTQIDSDVMLIGLPSGEKVVADVTFDGGSLILRNVLEILTMADGAGNYKFSLAPFMVYADPEAGISVPVTQVLMSIPGGELREAHKRQFSKIILPESNLVLSS